MKRSVSVPVLFVLDVGEDVSLIDVERRLERLLEHGLVRDAFSACGLDIVGADVNTPEELP